MSSNEDSITGWFAQKSKLAPDMFPIGIGDDMAQIVPGAESILITTDILLDKVHFDLEKTDLYHAGYKAMAASLSDCAAMASVPIAAVAAVALPKGFGENELKELHRGITTAGDRFNCQLVGGDITSWSDSGRFVINVTMLSKPGNSKPVTRSGAKPGDIICVTGTLGGSLAGKHLSFVPRVEEALELTRIATINSMMDISDGISTDLPRICKASKVGCLIDSEKIPVSEQAMKSSDPLNAALNDGEDFELLFTLTASEFDKLKNTWQMQTPITAIGQVTESPGMLINIQGKIQQLSSGGYDHLRGGQ